MSTLVVTFEAAPRTRALIADFLGAAATPVWLRDLDDQARAAALRGATAILARDTGKELRPHEGALIGPVRLIQFMTAGVDYIPLSQLPADAPIASNGGAYAEAMAEHGLAMTLAAAKRLLIEHNALSLGFFNQFTRNRTLRGATCGPSLAGGRWLFWLCCPSRPVNSCTCAVNTACCAVSVATCRASSCTSA